MAQPLKSNDVIGSANRGNPCDSGLCTLCRADCQGKCETWLSSMLGRNALYPRDFGMITAGSGRGCGEGVSYVNLRVNGFLYGARGAERKKAASGDSLFTDISLQSSFGARHPITSRYPFMTGALGSTFIAAKYWESFAVGSALCGIPIVIGENVVGVDQESVFENGRIVKSPELERRINTYLRYHDGFGAIIVQMNVEDTRNGVAEYLIDKFGDQVVLELKWGQGAKNIGGEIQVNSLSYARFLSERGYLVDPDPTLPSVKEAYEKGSIRSFARHSRMGYTKFNRAEQVETDFRRQAAYLRRLGFKRISLKTGAYGMEALALALKLACDCKLDLLTVDGAGGGTGMSPWDMMENWGVPSILLHSKAYEYASILATRGKKPADMAFAGGLARSGRIFKALALGSPFVKMVCMGRAMMIPGFLGSNIEGVLRPERRRTVNGNWDSLPKSVSEIGGSAEAIFACYHDVRDKVGHEEMSNIPYGAIAMWTLIDKLGAGLQQFMAGARAFSLQDISRSDIASTTRATEDATGIPFISDMQDEAARAILNG